MNVKIILMQLCVYILCSRKAKKSLLVGIIFLFSTPLIAAPRNTRCVDLVSRLSENLGQTTTPNSDKISEFKQTFQELVADSKLGHPLVLNKIQKTFFAKNAQNLISASLKYPKTQDFSHNLKTAKTIARLQARLQEMRGIAETLFASDESQTGYNQAMNYFAHLIRLADTVAYKIEGDKFSGFFKPNKPYHSEVKVQAEKPIHLRKFLENQQLDEIWQVERRFKPNGLFIPIYGELSIIDFNHLVGSGIFPIGLSEKTLIIDGTTLGPHEFAIHDTQHATRYIPGIFSPANLAVWNQLLDWADRATGKTKLIRHVVLYALTHEDQAFKSLFSGEKPPVSFEEGFSNVNTLYWGAFNDTSIRLTRENYWGLSELKDIKDLDRKIFDQAEILRQKYKNAISKILLKNLSEKQVKALLTEIEENNYLVEVPNGQRGFIGSSLLHRGAWIIQFKNFLKAGELDSSFYLNSGAHKNEGIRILATPKKMPKHGVALLATKLENDLLAIGFSPADLTLVKSNSKALLTFTEFLLDPKYQNKQKKILLLGNDSWLYRRLAKDRNYEVFDTLYDPYYQEGLIADTGQPWDADTGPRKDITEMFMSEAYTGYQMVFLLPKDFPKQAQLYGRKQGGYTFEEWRWLRANPDVMKNVIFVVGSEESLVPGEETLHNYEGSSSPSDRKRDRNITKLLTDPRAFLIE